MQQWEEEISNKEDLFDSENVSNRLGLSYKNRA